VNAASLGLGVLVGLVLGVLTALAGSAVRARRRTRALPAAEALLPAPLPAALSRQTTDALEAMRSAWLVVDGDDQVAAASSSAAVLGLVRGHRVALEALLRAVRAVRRSGQQGLLPIEPRGRPGPAGPAVMEARIAPLDGGLVAVIVDDRSEARRVDDVRRDFVANVSHELKTPVGALSLLAEAVEDASDDPDAVRRFAGRMHHEAARLATLVNELIDLSRLQSDDPLSHAEVIAVDDLVTVAVDRGRLHAEAKGITLAVGGEHGMSVFGDRKQLLTALSNLVDNAVNYSPARTKVALSVRAMGDDLGISVTDQGIGIPEADLDRVFERFYRVDPARSRATGGTGLGLSIVKHICSNHGGEVVVWSAEGAGSTFTLRLPRHGAGPPEAQPEPVEPAPSSREAAR
jgi:two-component system sensor histidine kinase SenX3